MPIWKVSPLWSIWNARSRKYKHIFSFNKCSEIWDALEISGQYCFRGRPFSSSPGPLSKQLRGHRVKNFNFSIFSSILFFKFVYFPRYKRQKSLTFGPLTPWILRIVWVNRGNVHMDSSQGEYVCFFNLSQIIEPLKSYDLTTKESFWPPNVKGKFLYLDIKLKLGK